MCGQQAGDMTGILLVEDNEGDARLVIEALGDSKIKTRLYHVSDGVEALDFLRKKGIYGDMPLPDLILLDLNLPRKDGRQFLADLKADEALTHIPVIVLSISDDPADIQECYRLHASCCITKPLDFTRFAAVMRSIEDFWLVTARLPCPGKMRR